MKVLYMLKLHSESELVLSDNVHLTERQLQMFCHAVGNPDLTLIRCHQVISFSVIHLGPHHHNVHWVSETFGGPWTVNT